jgi:hypothetical protein
MGIVAKASDGTFTPAPDGIHPGVADYVRVKDRTDGQGTQGEEPPPPDDDDLPF